MANSTTPVATSAPTSFPYTLPSTLRGDTPVPLSPLPANDQWSPLPSDIENHFQLMEQQLHGITLTLYRLQKLCPLVRSTPHVRTLTRKVESLGVMMRETVREMHDKMSIPFKVTQPAFQDELSLKSEIVLRPSADVPQSETASTSTPGSDSDPDLDSDSTPDVGATEQTITKAATCFRGEIPRVPRIVKRHGPGNLSKTIPYSLQVRDVPSGTFTSWHLPYKVVFTPDEKVLDVDGKPLPAIAVDVDENGGVEYVWKSQNQMADEGEDEDTTYAVPPRQASQPNMIRRVTLVPPQRITPMVKVAPNAERLTNTAIYFGGRVMGDFLRSTQEDAEKAAAATADAAAAIVGGAKKRKRGDETVESLGLETMKRQKTNTSSC